MSAHTNTRAERGRGIPSGGDGARPAFTVVEMIIAVAAVGLISVGLAQIFRATGEIGGDTAGTQGDDQNDDTCDIHTLYNSYAGTPQLHGNDSHPRRYD